ncbi:MAG: Hsp20/alpha crystallin family protein [Candidatus Buchananbacteria bacterium]
MALIKWTPFLGSSDDVDRFFDNWPMNMGNFTPAIDVYQDKDNVIVETPLAGIDSDKVDISVENDVLTIKGEVEKKSEVEDKDYYRKEIRSGSFYRAVQLPTRVSGDEAEATYENGILKISIPKAAEAKPKTIKISSKK